LGKSYKTGLPTIRIDYVFAGKAFTPVRHRSLATGFSDHFAQVADLRY
jgi:endonuclease/exonuclease/phosphatase (EEP) superfamily protein YafD